MGQHTQRSTQSIRRRSERRMLREFIITCVHDRYKQYIPYRSVVLSFIIVIITTVSLGGTQHCPTQEKKVPLFFRSFFFCGNLSHFRLLAVETTGWLFVDRFFEKRRRRRTQQ
jgi:hypothetical protein